MKRLYVAIYALLFVTILSACGVDSTKETKVETKGEVKSFDELDIPRKKSVNNNDYINEVPKGLSDNWESMQFYYLKENYDILGKN